MADRVKKVSYAYVMVPNRAGQGAGVLAALRRANVNLQAFSAFPGRGGKAQLVCPGLSFLGRAPAPFLDFSRKWDRGFPENPFFSAT